jgi:HlyD family secretion protein
MKRWLKNRKLLAVVAVILVLVVLAAWPRALPVDLASVERGALRVTLEEEGETRVRERFVISAPVAGNVLRIQLEPGDPVSRGKTVVATLQPAAPPLLDERTVAEARAALDAAEAQLGRARTERASAQAAVKLERSQVARHRNLLAAGAVARQALETREAAAQEAEQAVRGATFAVSVAEHQREMARARLQAATVSGGTGAQVIAIRSPIDGVVLRRMHESAAVVPAGEPLIELGDATRLEILADFLSTDAVRISPGNPVLIERWGGEGVLRGRVRQVEPAGFTKVSALGVEEQRVNVIIDLEEAQSAARRLGHGYRVEVAVVVWESADVLKVPTSSLFRRGESWTVFAVSGSRARLKTIDVGERNGSEAQVLAGLSVGERVIVHPGDALADGSRVSPRAQGTR